MLKPASSLCNLRCGYCFYAELSGRRAAGSFGKMQFRTAEAVLETIFHGLSAGDGLHLCFQGGEPTLAGLPLLRQIVLFACRRAGETGVGVRFSLQTNGLLLDEAWCAFLKEYRFLVGLSLDGPAVYHNAARPDAAGKGTWAGVLQAKTLLEKAGVPYNILCVLTNPMARHPGEIWRFLEAQEIAYVQFIPCLAPPEGSGAPWALNAKRYASFYTAFFELWLRAYDAGRYRSVKLFDDTIRLLAFGEVNACGLTGRCAPQLIVEADGSVYPCDFYALEPYRIGNLTTDSLETVLSSPVADTFLRRPVPKSPLCETCPYAQICGGGCPRMRAQIFCAENDGFCGQRAFLDACIEPMRRIAANERQARGR